MPDLMAVCDKCEVKERIGGPRIPGWEEREADSFFQRHATCNFSGIRVVLEHNPCPNRARDYKGEPLTVEVARESRVCRICEKKIDASGSPKGWEHSFGKMLYPMGMTLNFGKEFAHTACLEEVKV